MAQDYSNDKPSMRRQTPGMELSDELKKEIVQKIVDGHQTCERDRAEWLSRQEDYLSNWNDMLSPSRKGPFEGASNVHLPITLEQILAVHGRLMDILFSTHPWFYIKGREAADERKKQQNEILMQWELESHANRCEGIFKSIDAWIWDWCSMGRGIIKWYWEEEKETLLDVVPVVDEQGNVVGEREEERTETIFSGTCLRTVDPLNFFIPSGYSVVDAPVLFERMLLSENDLHCFKKYKYMIPSAVDFVLAHGSSTKDAHTQDAMNMARLRDELEGGVASDSENNKEGFEVLESYIRCDVNDDGYAERLIVWLERSTNTILGWNFVNRASKASRPPYSVIDYIPRKSEPMGLVELLYQINNMMDGVYNIRMDSGILSNIPWGTIRESRTLKAADIAIKPGEFIPVAEHNDLVVQSRPNMQPFFVQEEGMLQRHVDKLSVSELGQGLVPGVVGPLGTATGATAMLNEMNKRLSVLMMRVRLGFAEVLKGIYQLLKENLPLGTVFRVTGEDGKELYGQLESREMFMAQVDFTFVTPTATLNKEADRQNSLLWLQTVTNPLYIQLGLSTPQTLKTALQDVARAFGKQGLNNYIGEPQMQPIPQSIQEEISYILQGLMPYIPMNDDHPAKIQALVQHRDAEELSNFFKEPELYQIVVARFNQAIQKHQQWLQAIQAQAASSNVSGLSVGPTTDNRLAGLPTSAESPEGQGAPLGGGMGGSNAGMAGGTDTETPR